MFQQNYSCLNLLNLYQEVSYVQVHKSVLKSHKPFQNILLKDCTEKMENYKEKDVISVIQMFVKMSSLVLKKLQKKPKKSTLTVNSVTKPTV